MQKLEKRCRPLVTSPSTLSIVYVNSFSLQLLIDETPSLKPLETQTLLSIRAQIIISATTFSVVYFSPSISLWLLSYCLDEKADPPILSLVTSDVL